MAKQVTLTIDGKSVSVPAGTLVVDAAKRAGIDIPVFCYHPKMEPAGMCRMCLVEIGRPVVDRNTGLTVLNADGTPRIQFMPKLETACTNTVSEGMVVLTQSEKAALGQREIVEFLLTSHPLDCPVCDKGGECPLQNLTVAHGPGKSRFIYDEKHRAEKHVPLGDLIYLDRERCIQCARCVRFQDLVAGEPVIGFFNRGRNLEIVTFSEPGFDSVFSGNTTDICPVGALTTADFRFGARPWELKSAASICGHCPVGCNLTVDSRREASSDGRVVIKRVMPRQHEAVNEIWICDKGRFAHHYVESPDRLARPLVRKDGALKPAGWETAIKAAAEKLAAARKNLVVLAGGRLASEDLFNLKQLADRTGGQALLYSHMGGGELTALVGVAQGTDLGALGKGSVILVAASDLQNEAPLWWLRVKQAADRGATLVVANPRETSLDRHASYVVRYAYGDEVKAIQDLAPGAKGNAIVDAVRKAENLVVLFGSEGLGLEGSSALALACAHLLQASGRAGKPGSGLIGVWPHANDQGAFELGFRPAADLAAALKGKTVYVVAADPAGDDPALAAALKGAKAVIVQDLFRTASAELADVVLPAQAHFEREGTFVSGERRVQRFYPGVPAFSDTRPDFAITADLGRRLGVELEGRSAALVFDRLAAQIWPHAGLSYQTLAESAPQWPVVGRSDLYYGGSGYENHQGLGVQLQPAAQRGEAVRLPAVRRATGLRAKENELLAVPVTRLYDRGATVAPSALLEAHIGPAVVNLHPEAARRLDVGAGETLAFRLDGASAQAVVRLDEAVPAGVALLPRSMGLPVTAPAALSAETGKTARKPAAKSKPAGKRARPARK